ncbi:MAG: glycoside hydrolase family 65 protein [Ilumatobacter sp.]|nr:MAG: glycoside hydrolase family 65 protein [Ilumatobacter sp.]
MTRLSDEIRTDTGWDIIEDRHVADRAVTIGSNFLVGNGYLGYRATRPDQTADDFVACTVSDTYDMADGRWRELCNAPNGLLVDLALDGRRLQFSSNRDAMVALDLRNGLHEQRSTWTTIDGGGVEVTVRRFAGLHDLHLLGQELTVVPLDEGELDVVAGIDARVWSLNGNHFCANDDVEVGDVLVHQALTVERGTSLVVASHTTVDDVPGSEAERLTDDQRMVRRWSVPITAGVPVVITTWSSVASSNDIVEPIGHTLDSVRRARANGFEVELGASAAAWSRFWEHSDVRIEGDVRAQAALRFCLYHNRIATPAHSDRLPVGARGLSCQAYQGAAFWDQEIFNLPAFLFTEPDIARNLLVYRWRTLDGARRKAKRLGYDGAFYAWISGDTGDELCPDFFFVDVLTGRPIRNHFNDWQIHVSPDISYTVWRFWKLTADWEFMVDHGAEMLFEVARFCHSFVLYNEHRDRYECRQLLGPDEWHENVHNDAYTNHLVHMALSHAIDAIALFERRDPGALDALFERLDLDESDIEAWHRVRDRLHLPAPHPETGVIEQFDGFFDLEECWPEDLDDRVIDHGEYWGHPNGVAVFTQVSKQPAVLQLFHLDHTLPLEIQGANYSYYEPRCAHGSSLSHSVHALVATRLGLLDEAYRYFWQTATIDLLSTSKAVVGGTFIGGIHTAACGGAYQAAVFGFGGLDALEGTLVLNPRLPPEWEALEFEVVLRRQRASVRAEQHQLTVTAGHGNTAAIPVQCRDDAVVQLEPGRSLVRPGDHHPWI